MTNKAKRELSDFEIDEISVVDKAANKRKFLILKSESQDFLETLNQFIEIDDKEVITKFVKGMANAPESVDGEYIKKYFPPQMMQHPMMAGFMQPQPDLRSISMLTGIADQLSRIFSIVTNLDNSNKPKMDVDQGDVTEEDVDNSFTPEPEMIEKTEEIMSEEKNQDTITPEKDVVDVEKALADARATLEKEFADKVAALEVDRVNLLKEKEDHRMKTFVAKAEKLSILGAESAEDLASVLKGIEDASPELLVKVEALLNKAASVVSNVGLLKEIGDTGEDLNKTEDELIIARRDGIMKEDASMTKEKAYTQAYKEINKR